MSIRIVYLSPSDGIDAIVDRLRRVDASDRLLLVLPDEPLYLAESLDLLRIRRLAERRNLEIGVVTVDAAAGVRAKSLGFATFATVQQAEHGRWRWWRARRLRRKPVRQDASVDLRDGRHYASLKDPADRLTVHLRMRQPATWRRWLGWYLGFLLFTLALTLLVIALIYSVPSATLVLRPETRPIAVAVELVADPQLEQTGLGGKSVPARLLTTIVEWRATVDTTGTAQVADGRAQGKVVFFNLLDQPFTVPAGTRVGTSAGEQIVYQVLSDVEVPGSVGGAVDADIVAVLPGPQGNVAAQLVNRVQGSLSTRLGVRNLAPTEGGSSRAVAAVREADLVRLREHVLEQLNRIAAAEMEQVLAADEFLALDSLRVAAFYEETYSSYLEDRTDRLTLEMRAEIEGTAVQAAQAEGQVLAAIEEAIIPGFELVPGSVQFAPGELLGVDGQGRVSFMFNGQALSVAMLEMGTAVDSVAGQEIGPATAFLTARLPLRSEAEIAVWPDWFSRVPYLPARIQTIVEIMSP